MNPSTDNSAESRLSRWPVFIFVLLAALTVVTKRIECAILLLGLFALTQNRPGSSFWRLWAIAFVSLVSATLLVACQPSVERTLLSNEILPNEILPGEMHYPIINTLTPWLTACVFPIVVGYVRWKDQQLGRRTKQRTPFVGLPNFDSQQTCDLSDLANESEETDIHSGVYTSISNCIDGGPRSPFSLQSDEIDRVLSSLRVEGDFSDLQLRLLDETLRRTIFRRGSDDADLLDPGRKLGSYTIKKLLNQGGGGRVYVAQHNPSDQLVALKVLRSRKLNSRFRREMSLVEKLAHPNIVVAYEVDEQDGVPFIAMELLSGVDLHAQIRAEGAVDYPTSLNWILQAARALAHADERGLTHRDVKPGNLILHRDNVLKLTDLGLAVLRSSERDSISEFVTQDAAVVGTLEFMAPEQAKSLASADARSDIFGLGATWFFLLEGKAQLPGKTMKDQLSALLVDRKFHVLSDNVMPANARAVIDRMIAFDPNDRFQNWSDVIEALLALSNDSDSNDSPSIRVLLVEDNADDIVLTTRMLSKMNHSVLVQEATTFAEAKDLLAQGLSFDVILADLQLPDTTNLGTVKALRACDATTPLIVLSGFSDDSIGQACIDAGADAYASKDDLTVHELERAIFITRSQCENSSTEHLDSRASASTH